MPTKVARLIEFAHSKVGDEFGWQRKFAEMLEMSPQQLNNILSERVKIGLKVEEKLVELGCNLEWLRGKSSENKTVAHPKTNMRPVYAAIPAGKGSISKAYAYLEAPPDVHDEGKGYWIKVKGDSMAPRFNDGDMIFVNPTLEVHSGDIAVVYWNDHQDGAIKKIHLEKATIVLQSLNTNYPPIIVPIKSVSAMARICYIKL